MSNLLVRQSSAGAQSIISINTGNTTKNNFLTHQRKELTKNAGLTESEFMQDIPTFRKTLKKISELRGSYNDLVPPKPPKAKQFELNLFSSKYQQEMESINIYTLK